MLEHVWFDFGETIVLLKKDNHDQLRYATYSEVVHKPVSKELIAEYESLFTQSHHSNSAVFHSLGLPSGYWSEHVNSVDPQFLFELADPRIPEILQQLRTILPISLFSNIELGKALPAFGLDPVWFTHILSSGMVKKPKPALDGFYQMVALSGVSADHILYIGDDVGKDVLTAKQVGMQAGLMWKQSNAADYCFKNFAEILTLVKELAHP